MHILGLLTARLTLLCWAGFLSVAAVALAWTYIQDPFGSIAWSSLLAVCCGFVASVAVGVVAAQWLPGYLSAGVTLVVIFAWGYLGSGLSAAVEPLQGLAVSSDQDRTFFEVIPWVLIVRSIFFVALAAALVSVAARHSSTWFVSLSVLCISATPLILAGATTMKFIPEAIQRHCEVRGTVEVCLTKARWHEADDVFLASKPLLHELRGLNPGRIVLREETLQGAQKTVTNDREAVIPIGLVNGFNGNAHQVKSRDLTLLLSTRIFRERCVAQTAPNGNLGPIATATDVIEAWALTSIGVPVDGSGGFNAPVLTDDSLDWRAVEGFRKSWDAADDDVRTRWLAGHRREVYGCTTTASDTFP